MIADRIHDYAATLNRKFTHDRSKTVGASEIGACARRTWFSKRDAPRDDGYTDSWGPRVRGNVIEEAFWEPAMRATLREGEQLLFAGDDQRTLTSGHLSATTDGLLILANGTCINLDCKSIDPRADISKEKSAHHFQVQVQMGLIRESAEYRPDVSVLTYIDASFWDRIQEFSVAFDPRIYAQAHARATQIMTARDALSLPPEGKMAGGDECRICPWASHCADVTVAGVPQKDHDSQLGENAVAVLRDFRDEAAAAAALTKQNEAWHAEIAERIKTFLRENNSRGYKGDGWSVTYTTASGRTTLDREALEADGIDLAKYQKEGKPSERLTVK